MRCTVCNAELPQGSVFCENCGGQVSKGMMPPPMNTELVKRNGNCWTKITSVFVWIRVITSGILSVAGIIIAVVMLASSARGGVLYAILVLIVGLIVAATTILYFLAAMKMKIQQAADISYIADYLEKKQ